jgi:ClpP class serine protease
VSVLEVVEEKPVAEINDRTLILASVARKAIRQVKSSVIEVLTSNGMEQQKAHDLAETLAGGQWTHDYPISIEAARDLGLPVSDTMPLEVYDLMDLYPQASGRRPSVQYIPVPYRRGPAPTPNGDAGP